MAGKWARLPQNPLLHPRPFRGATDHSAQNAAGNCQRFARQSHFRIVSLVAVRRPNLAVAIGAVPVGDHIPDNLLADIFAFRLCARAVVGLHQNPAQLVTTGRDLDLSEISVVVGLGLPKTLHGIGGPGGRSTQHQYSGKNTCLHGNPPFVLAQMFHRLIASGKTYLA